MIIHNASITGSFSVNGTNVASITSSQASIDALNTFSSSILSFTASTNTFTASAATTGSNTFVGNQVVTGSLNVSGSITTPGTLTAQTLVVQTITSSVDFVTGSTKFGSIISNTHQFTGSMSVSGSGTFVGNITAGDVIRVSGSGAYFTISDTQASSRNWAIRAGHDEVGDLAIRQSNSAGGDPVSAGTTRLYINASGSVGIGVIPTSTWNTITPVLQIGYTAFSAYLNTQAIYSSNAVYNSGWKYISSTNATYYSQNETAAGEHAWKTAPSGTAGNALVFTQVMTLDASGRLGIGTTSPSQRLHVANSSGGVVAFIQSTATNGEASLSVQGRNSSGTAREMIFKYDNTDIFRIGTASAIAMRFETSDVERVRITSGGNVNIGSSTSAGYGLLGNSNLATSMGITFHNGSTYSKVGGVISVQESGGSHALALYTRSGGDEGEKMRITSGGNVVINSTVANYKFQVNSGINTSTATVMTLQQATNGAVKDAAGFGLAINNGGESTNAADLIISTASGGSLGERMRITSGGNVLIGNTSGDGRFYVKTSTAVSYSPTVYTGTNANIRLETGGTPAQNITTGISMGVGGAAEAYIGAVQNASTYADIVFQSYNGAYGERMRISSAGNVGIGTNNPAERLHIYGGGSGPEIRLEGSYGSWYIRAYNDNFNIYSPSGRQNISCLNNGDVRNYNNTTTWQTTSDFRVKENISTISNALNTVLSLNPVTFDYKEEFAQKNNWDNNKKNNNAGFIAQEFETIFPKYVSTSEYAIEETIIDDFKSIDTGHLVAYLVKAIQELKAEFDEYKLTHP